MNGLDKNKYIDIEIEIDKNDIKINVKDEGDGFIFNRKI